jgi:hypothetical protein
MGHLEQFARNRRGKEKTEVLTARLPESLYRAFKTHCDELRLSISEAVCLLVEHEMKGVEVTNDYIDNDSKQDEYKSNHDVVEMYTELNTEVTTDVIETNTSVVEKEQMVSRTNTKRFTTKHFVLDGKLPCPICNQWVNHSNFARHAKHHGSNTQAIFTNEENLKQINNMIEERKAVNQGEA